MSFKRPQNLEFPTVYYKFKAKSNDNNEIIQYRVQDLPDDRFEEALEMVKNYYIPEESLCAGKEIHKDTESRDYLLGVFRDILKEHLSLACFRNDDNDDLVAVNFLVVHSKDDPKLKVTNPTKIVKEMFDAMAWMAENGDIYGKYNVDQYLQAYGLCVNKPYRGKGIATGMLKARAYYLKHLGLKITGTAFTAIASQIAAKKAGFEDYFVKSYEELKQIDPHFDFTNNPSNTKLYKLMALNAEKI